VSGSRKRRHSTRRSRGRRGADQAESSSAAAAASSSTSHITDGGDGEEEVGEEQASKRSKLESGRAIGRSHSSGSSSSGGRTSSNMGDSDTQESASSLVAGEPNSGSHGSGVDGKHAATEKLSDMRSSHKGARVDSSAGSSGSSTALTSSSSSTAASSVSALTHQSSPIITPAGHLIERTPLVRILAQTLNGLGYGESARALERESGIQVEERGSAALRESVLAGRWDEARACIDSMHLTTQQKNSMRKIIAEQKYICMMEAALIAKSSESGSSSSSSSTHAMNGSSNGLVAENGTHMQQHIGNGRASNGTSTPSASNLMIQAVQFLQQELFPLFSQPSTTRPSSTSAVSSSSSSSAISASVPRPSPSPSPHLLHLASLFTCSSLAMLNATYRGAAVLSSQATDAHALVSSSSRSPYLPVFQRLSTFLPSQTCVADEHRLFRLLDHSIQAQIDQCNFHHAEPTFAFDLLTQHQCTLTLPSSPLVTLSDHSDEVHFAAFSHINGGGSLRLATCSKDGTIRIFTYKPDSGKTRRSSRQEERSALEREEKKTSTTTSSSASSHVTHSPSHASNGHARSGSSTSSQWACTATLRAPVTAVTIQPASPSLPSRSPQSSESPSASSSSCSSSCPQPFFFVSWSPNNRYLLACNGVDACVFDVSLSLDVGASSNASTSAPSSTASSGVGAGSCILTVGAKALDAQSMQPTPENDTNMSAPSERQGTARTSASAAAGGGTPPTTSRSGAAATPSSASRSSSSNPASSSSPSSPPAPSVSASALAHVSRLLASPLLASLGIRGNVRRTSSAGASGSGSGSGGGRGEEDESSMSAQESSQQSEAETVIGHVEPVTCCAWCADGTSFITGSADRRLIMWDLSGNILDVWSGDMISDMVCIGTRLIVATPYCRCVVFDVRDRKIEEIFSFMTSSSIASISLSPDAHYALLNLIRPAELQVWHLGPTEEQLDAVVHMTTQNWPTDAHLGHVLTQSLGSQDGTSASLADVHAAPTSAASSLASSSMQPSRSDATDTPRAGDPTPMTDGGYSVPPPLSSPFLAPTLCRRYTGFRANRYVVGSCFAGPSCSLLLSGSEDSLVYVWQRSSGRLIGTLNDHTATVNAVTATTTSQGKHLIASASDDYTIKIWQIKTGIHNVNKQHATQKQRMTH